MMGVSARLKKAFEEKYGGNVYDFLDDLPYSVQAKVDFLICAAQDEGYDKGRAASSDDINEDSFNDGYYAALDDIISSIKDLDNRD